MTLVADVAQSKRRDAPGMEAPFGIDMLNLPRSQTRPCELDMLVVGNCVLDKGTQDPRLRTERAGQFDLD